MTLPAWLGRLNSVRVRITVIATIVVGVVLTGAGFALIELQERSLTDNIDKTIRLRADDITSLLEDGTLPENITVTDDQAALVQILDGDGRIVVESSNIAGEGTVAPRIPEPGETEIAEVTGLSIEIDETFRVLSRTLVVDEGTFTVSVAGSLETVGDSTESLLAILQVGIPLLIIAVAAGTWFGVGRALSPVEAIRKEVAEITDRELSRRVPESPGDHEIGRLARTMNEMLARLEEAHLRQERFVGDASHELRSPLASVRTQLEVDLAHPDSADWSATAESLLEEAVRMQALIDDLLFLAQSDADALSPGTTLIDIDDIVLREATRPRPRGDIVIDTAGRSGVAVERVPTHIPKAPIAAAASTAGTASPGRLTGGCEGGCSSGVAPISSRTIRISPICCTRPRRSFVTQRRRSRRNLVGTPVGSAFQSGSRSRIAATVSETVSPGKARRPVSTSYKQHPKAQTSARRSTGLPRACSGLMYGAVPRTDPSAVSFVSVGDCDNSGFDESASDTKALARPKSRIFTSPVGEILMFAGFKSR